jgi:hypothetical protein
MKQVASALEFMHEKGLVKLIFDCNEKNHLEI